MLAYLVYAVQIAQHLICHQKAGSDSGEAALLRAKAIRLDPRVGS